MILVFATNNANKVKEIQSILPDSIQIKSLESIGCTEDIEETATTIEGNAILKANYVYEKYGYNCFADDTGLEVEILNNEPGVFSARYAGDHKDNTQNIIKLLDNIKEETNRKARFKTVICLNINGTQHLFTGICNGTITKQSYGLGGFGYDSIFCPDGHTETFAELPLEVKNKISHRAKATRELIEFINKDV
jgi:XTP/dITP diphosphohydrolase